MKINVGQGIFPPLRSADFYSGPSPERQIQATPLMANTGRSPISISSSCLEQHQWMEQLPGVSCVTWGQAHIYLSTLRCLLHKKIYKYHTLAPIFLLDPPSMMLHLFTNTAVDTIKLNMITILFRC